MKLFKMIGFYFLGCLMFAPMFFLMSYFILGCSKEKWMTLIDEIPADRIWVVIVLLAITNFIAVIYFFNKAMTIMTDRSNVKLREELFNLISQQVVKKE